MVFREFFSDGEIYLYSVMAQSVTTVTDKESFEAFVQEVDDMLKQLPEGEISKVVVLGLLMGAYMVQRVTEDFNQAERN